MQGEVFDFEENLITANSPQLKIDV
jgi:hypothetical protein